MKRCIEIDWNVCRTAVEVLGRSYVRTEYFIRAAECPEDYHSVLAAYEAGGHGHRAGAAAATMAAAGQAAAAEEHQGQQGTVGSAAAAAASSMAAPAGLLPIGVTCYTQLFSGAELQAIEEGSGKGRGGLSHRSCACY